MAPEFCERLAQALSQLWRAGADDLPEGDRERFDAILVRIVPTTTVGTRIELSDSLARSTTPPRGILLVLAHDDIAIAGSILRLSPALCDDDLVDIARRCGVGHMSAIAERRELSIRVTDVLVLRGDDRVRRVVVANAGAHLSDKSFARLSLQTREDTEIGLVLVARADLPDLVVRFLETNGTPEVRRALIERESHPRDNPLTAQVAKSIRRAEDGWLEPYDFDEARQILSRLGEARHQIDVFVRRLAQRDRFAELVLVLAEMSGIPVDLVKHMMVSLDTDPFVKVARAIGLKGETVQEILLVGPWLHRLDARSREATMLAFQATDVDDARARVRRWAGGELH
ncbi:MAG: DUF2336 domain-containing protein [Phyllobacteriaceae bacterium]|nr:DUF2336 domain-containing protein [Phyllobacteriaceae bacterium]